MNEAAQFVEDLIEASAQSAKIISVERNEFLIEEGKVERNIYLVESGALRIFFLSEFEEHTIRLGYKGSFITSLTSFLKGTPSEFYIQAIRKCKLRVITKKDLQDFIAQEPNRIRQYNALLEELVVQSVEREIDVLTQSPIERLKRVLKRSPHLFQEVPAKYIASYLRMTPETLSRIRKS